MNGKLQYKIRKRIDVFSAYVYFVLKRPSSKNKKNVFIDISRIVPNRRLYHLCRLLGENGLNNFVKLPFSQFKLMDIYGLAATRISNVFSAGKIKKTSADLLVTDSSNRQFPGKKIILDYSVFDYNSNFDLGLFYPIHFHPDYMNRETESVVRHASRSTGDRKIGVLFAGNVDRDSYNNEQTVSTFGIHTRWDIFNDLVTRLPADDKFVPESYGEFISMRDSGMLRTKVTLIDINRFKIPREIWFDILGDTVFFLHLPGYIQPWCHNQIESMAAGAIPILEYPEIFHPILKKGESALTFSDKDDLLDLLKQILHGKLHDNSVAMMHKNVLAYYDTNLSFDSFSSKLDSFLKSTRDETKMYICAGDFSLQA